METKSLFYPVEKVKVSEILPGYSTNKQKDYAIITKVDGKPKLLNLCSKGYQLVENETIISHARYLLELSGFNTQLTYTHYDNSKFFIDLTLDVKKFGFGLEIGKKKDILVPKLRLVNSYDGSIKYNASASILRLVCTNGLTMPVAISSFRKRHTKQLEGDKAVEMAIEMIQKIIESTDIITESWDQLVDQTVVDIEDRVMEVIENTGFPITLAENVIEKVVEEQKIFNLPRPNDWLVYNGFNFELNHNFEDTVLKEHKREIIDRNIQTYLLEN